VSNFLERIYYDYDNYAGSGAPEAILFRRNTTIFIFIDRYLASSKKEMRACPHCSFPCLF